MAHRLKRSSVVWPAFACAALLLAGCSPAPAELPEIGGVFAVADGRALYLQCRGTGSPTVVLVSGTGGASDEWTHILDPADPLAEPTFSAGAVFGRVAQTGRVCAYDRPGTVRFDGTLAPSTPIPQPSTAHTHADDLRALLAAAGEGGPYVLVGASWGGLITQAFARMHPVDIAGLVLVDSAAEFLADAFTSAQWSEWTAKAATAPPGSEAPDYVASVDQIRAAPPLPPIPVVVLTSDHPWDLQVGDTGSTWPGWLSAQGLLAEALHASHIKNTDSGHPIANEQPELVADVINGVRGPA